MELKNTMKEEIVKVKKNETFSIELQSASGGGYLWMLASKPLNVIVKETEAVKSTLPKSEVSQEVGSHTKQKFTFKALNDTTLHFVHKRTWETEIIDEVMYCVVVVD